MKTKYEKSDFDLIAKDLVTAYNNRLAFSKNRNSIRARFSNGYYIEVSDNGARLVLNHPELICMVL